MLIFVIDAAGSESRKPHHDLRHLIQELKLYDPSLLKMPGVVFANKSDIKENLQLYSSMLEREAKINRLQIVYGSGLDGSGIGELAVLFRQVMQNEPKISYGRKK
jgi:GTP-binding protein